MGIDYVINYGCVPKELFTTPGLLARVKAGDRAQAIINFYRRHGDQRPIEEMGGEVSRRAAIGEDEVEVVQVPELLAQHAELEAYQHYCEGCAANYRQAPFGCIGNINYPISQAAELWLLSQLPSPEEPLPFLLLTKAEEFGYRGNTAQALREANPGVLFESGETLARRYPEMDISNDQLFELFFLLGDVIPLKRMVMILLFMNAIPRDMQANELMALSPAPEDAAQRLPFQLRILPGDDRSIIDFKHFFHAMYLAYTLNRELQIDV